LVARADAPMVASSRGGGRADGMPAGLENEKSVVLMVSIGSEMTEEAECGVLRAVGPGTTSH